MGKMCRVRFLVDLIKGLTSLRHVPWQFPTLSGVAQSPLLTEYCILVWGAPVPSPSLMSGTFFGVPVCTRRLGSKRFACQLTKFPNMTWREPLLVSQHCPEGDEIYSGSLSVQSRLSDQTVDGIGASQLSSVK